MRKEIRARDYKYTVQFIAVFIIGIVLIVWLTKVKQKLVSDEPPKQKVQLIQNTEKSMVNVYEPFDATNEKITNDIENFFTLHFPLKKDWDDQPFDKGFIPDEFTEELISKYGYHLFLEGLKYDNPYAQWYSAYRLIEFYNEDIVEEIMLALTECEKSSTYEEVKKACHFSKDVLSGQIENNNSIKVTSKGEIIFTRFFEDCMRGGQKAYSIQDNILREIFIWDDPTFAVGIQDIEVSKDGKYAWFQVRQENKYLQYVIELEKEKYPYYVKKERVYARDGAVDDELSILNEDLNQKIEGTWLENNTLQLSLKGTKYIYNEKFKTLDEEMLEEQKHLEF